MSVTGRWALKVAISAAIAGLSQVASAEYYLEYPEPVITQFIEYTSPNYHHKMKKRHSTQKASKHRSHYDITVTYYWPVCPGCACAVSAPGCYPNDEQLNTRAVTGGYVTFRYDEKNFRGMKHRKYEVNPTYDQRTEDDDVMRNPDMNNQYNMF